MVHLDFTDGELKVHACTDFACVDRGSMRVPICVDCGAAKNGEAICRAALEETAKVCDSYGASNVEQYVASRECAIRIRSLIERQEGR
jgi:hypothetical protein